MNRRFAVFSLLVTACFALFPSCTRPRLVSIVPGPPEPRNDSPFEAAEYFRSQRVPDGRDLPIDRYLLAQRHAAKMRREAPRDSQRVQPLLATPAAAGIGAWESLGPGNVGGRTRGLLIHPRNSAILWLGAATGGIWKSTDGGSSWRAVSDFASVLTVNCLVMDPSDPDTLYACTGEQTQNWRGAGIFKSSDGGESWSQLPATATSDFYFVNNIAVSRVDRNRLYAATNTGIWASADGGASWRISLSSPEGERTPSLTGATTNGCFDLALQPGLPADQLFAVCHPPGSLAYAIFRNPSASASGAWTMVHSDPHMWYTVLAIAPSDPATIYAVAVTNDSASPYAKALLAVYRSRSSGAAGTWQTRVSNQDSNRLNTGILSIDAAYNFNGSFCTSARPNLAGQHGYNLAAAVDPLNADSLWVAAVGIFRSDDGGANWGYAYAGVHPDQHVLAFDPGYNGASNQILYAANDGGIFKTIRARGVAGTCASRTTGVTWTSLNNGYGTTQFYHGMPFPGGAAYFGGTQDNGTVRGFDARGPNQWDFIFGGDGGVSRVDPVNASMVYVETPHAGFARSSDGGNSYQDATAGLDEDELNFAFVAPLEFDPANSLRLYTGGRRLWRSEDGAARWTAASAEVDSADGNIRAIAISPADPNVVLFAASRGRIFQNASALAANGGTTWASAQPRAGNVSDIEFDPREPSVVYATYTTFNEQPSDQHVYRSLDSGVTWTGIDGSGDTGLPDIPVQTLLVDPDDSSRLYVGTDLGLFTSFDRGATWVRAETPFAHVVTTTLSIVRNAGVRYLYAFTYGRGVWRAPLDGVAPRSCSYAISPASISADATGGVYPVEVTTDAGCVWSVSPAVTAATAFASAQGPAQGTGGGRVFVTVVPNRTTAARNIVLMVQDQPLAVTQGGARGAALGNEMTAAVAVTSLPSQITSNNTALTQNGSDPRHSCTGGADFRTGWLRFTASDDGTVQVSVQAVRQDTGAGNSGIVVAAYALDGNTPSTELACASVEKDTGPVRAAVIRFAVSAGSQYAIEVGSLSTGANSDLANLFIGIAPALPRPMLDVSPSEAVTPPGGTIKFQAVGIDLPNAGVRWSVTPQAGMIAPDGTFTAPASATSGIVVTAQSFANPELRATATVSVQPPAPVGLNAPAVTNGASFQTGPVAPGEVITIFGQGIGPAVLAQAQLNVQGRLASVLDGTQVLFDGVPAPLVYAAAQQVSAIVPYEVAGQAGTRMVVVRNGRASPPLTLQVAASAPAWFTADSSGTGQAAALNQDGSRNSPQSPALPGSVVAIYATGEGQTAPGGINGRIASAVVPKPLLPVSVSIGGIEAEVLYAGAAPQAVAGLLQVNVRIPEAARPGANAVILRIGNAASRAGVTIAVR